MYFASSLSWNKIWNHLHLCFIMTFLFPYDKNQNITTRFSHSFSQFTTIVTECHVRLVALLHIEEIWVQISVQRTPILFRVFMVFLNPSRQILQYSSNYATTSSFRFPSNSLFINHPVIQCFVR